jgi:hypothetical protein
VSVSSARTRFVPEPEDPALVAANQSVGVRLLVSAIVFVFMAFVFAFFYLKAVNSNDNWHPAHVTPSQGWGIAVLVCVLGTALLFEVGRRALADAVWSRWRPAVAGALVLALIAFVLQVIQLTQTGFGATGGGYASVFYGWNALAIPIWLGAVYWVETLLVGARPGGTVVAAEVSGEPLEQWRPSADACLVYLYAMAGIWVVAYVLLYLIK